MLYGLNQLVSFSEPQNMIFDSGLALLGCEGIVGKVSDKYLNLHLKPPVVYMHGIMGT